MSRERFFGGDATPIPATFPTCSSTAAASYELSHTYIAGSRASTQYTGTSFLVLDLDIDTNTGMPKTSRDTAGVGTAYTYDSLGRIATIKPAGHSWISATYTNATASTQASASQRECGTAESTCTSGTLNESRYFFDDFGRLTQQAQLMPGPVWSTSWTSYDTMGRASFQSVPATGTGAFASAPSGIHGTTSTFDWLGRTRTITAPDGSTTSIEYPNPSTTLRTSSVYTSTGVSPVTTRETTDYLGRLVSVTEDDGGLSQITTYGYDIGNRLSTVTMPSQGRSFVYDDAGLLRGETHPESGTAKFTYDARGQVLQRSADDCHFDLAYTYDAAGRLTLLEERTPAACTANAWQPLKEFSYAGVSATEKSLGKLRQSVRHNRTPAGDLAVTESFTYDNTGGRVIRKDTTVSDASNVIQTFAQQFAYNDRDELTSELYPVCGTGAGCGQAKYFGAARTLTNGLLTAVKTGPYATSLPSTAGTGVAPPAAGAMILESHVTSLRSAMNAALVSHGLPTPAYEDAVLTLIRARHLQQLQERSQ